MEQSKTNILLTSKFYSILFCYHLISTAILTVGAGAIMPIGTGIIGVPKKDKTFILICHVEITDEYK